MSGTYEWARYRAGCTRDGRLVTRATDGEWSPGGASLQACVLVLLFAAACAERDQALAAGIRALAGGCAGGPADDDDE